MSSSAIKKLWKSSIHLIRTVLRIPPFNICILMKSLLNINNILPFDSSTRLWSIANIPWASCHFLFPPCSGAHWQPLWQQIRSRAVSWISPFSSKIRAPRGHFKCNFHLPSTNFVVSRLRTQQYHGYAISSIRLAISQMVSWGNLPATSFTQDLPPWFACGLSSLRLWWPKKHPLHYFLWGR
jgi:hypothetical protein